MLVVELAEMVDNDYKVVEKLMIQPMYKFDTELTKYNYCGICGLIIGAKTKVNILIDQTFKEFLKYS